MDMVPDAGLKSLGSLWFMFKGEWVSAGFPCLERGRQMVVLMVFTGQSSEGAG